LAAACADNRVHHLGTHFSRRLLLDLRAEPGPVIGWALAVPQRRGVVTQVLA
jgi:hypothetical protein